MLTHSVCGAELRNSKANLAGSKTVSVIVDMFACRHRARPAEGNFEIEGNMVRQSKCSHLRSRNRSKSYRGRRKVADYIIHFDHMSHERHARISRRQPAMIWVRRQAGRQGRG